MVIDKTDKRYIIPSDKLFAKGVLLCPHMISDVRNAIKSSLWL